MDIDLFSEIIKGLILDNDEVTLPGLGTFVSEVMPSVFSDKGYTINPPYRKLSFRRRESGDGRLLAEFYAEANGMDVETSEKILSEYIAGLRTILQNRKIVVFPGLGRLRATKENTFFFIADEDLDIYPYGVGLEPVSLKTHEETADEVSDGIAALREVLDGPAGGGGLETGVSRGRSLRQAQRARQAQRQCGQIRLMRKRNGRRCGICGRGTGNAGERLRLWRPQWWARWRWLLEYSFFCRMSHLISSTRSFTPQRS